MDHKCNKQYWLESALKKLYKKKQALNARVKKRRRKRKSNFLPPTPCSARKKIPKLYPEKSSVEEKLESDRKKFWEFVDEYLFSRSVYERSKNYFLNGGKKPSTVDYAVWKSIRNSLNLSSSVICSSPAKHIVPQSYEGGSSIALRSRIVYRKSDKPTKSKENVKSRSSITLRSRIINQESDKPTMPKQNIKRSSVTLRSRFIKQEPDTPPTMPKQNVKGTQGNSISLNSRVNGNSINLRSRVICRTSDHQLNNSERSIFKKKGNPVDQEKSLALKIFSRIQKARIRKATDVISKEFMSERKY